MEPDNDTNQTMPEIAPTVLACYLNGWLQMKRYFLDLLLLVAVSFVLIAISGLPLSTEYSQVVSNNGARQTSMFAVLYLILVYEPVSYGISYAFLKAAREESPEIGSVLEVLKNYTSAVMSRLLCFTIVGLGIGLLVIPGIFLGCRLAFVRYLVVEEKMDSIESVKMSWQLTHGHTLAILGIGLTALLIYLAGLIAFGVGIIFSIIWVKLAFASFYHSVVLNNDKLKNYGRVHAGNEEAGKSTYKSVVGTRLRNMLEDNDEENRA